MEIPASHIDILHSKSFAHAATVRSDGRLSVHPVTVLLHDGQVCFSTLKSRGKYRNLVRDPRLSLSIPHPDNPWHYLELRGRARLEDDPQRTVIDQIARKYLGQDRYPYDKDGDERVTVILDIEQIWAPAVHGASKESFSELRSQVYGGESS